MLEEAKERCSSTSAAQGSNGDHLAILNHALQVSVRANRPQVTELLLNHGASELMRYELLVM